MPVMSALITVKLDFENRKYHFTKPIVNVLIY